MSSENENARSRVTQDQNETMSGSAHDGQRRPGRRGGTTSTPIEKPGPAQPPTQPTPGEFGERGMGIAAKE